MDVIDVSWKQYDLFIIEQCNHFKDTIFMGIMRDIQNYSAIVFFLLIHIPLSKLSSLYSFMTSIVPLILNRANKDNLYISLSQTVNITLIGDIETEILRKNTKFKTSQALDRYNHFRSSQRWAINFTVFYFGLFWAITVNFLITSYLGQFMVIITLYLIFRR